MLLALTAAALLPLLAQVPTGTGPSTFEYELNLRPGEVLLEYSWEEAGPVPFLRPDPVVRIPFGERGRREGALLYLPGNRTDEGATTGAGLVTAQALNLTEGRFGTGLALAPDTYVHYRLPRMDRALPGWTLSFWLRPAAAAFGKALLVMDGTLDLYLQVDGRVRATLPGGVVLQSPPGLSVDRWSFVQLSADPAQTGQLRLLVDDRANGMALPPGPPPALPLELKLGDLGRGGRGPSVTLDEFVLEARPLSTARALELRAPPLEPGAHALQMKTSLGLRSAEPIAGLIGSSYVDTPADLLLGQLEGAAVVGSELRWVPARWRRIVTEDAPAPRTTHPVVSLGGGRTFVFGGETRDTDVWPMVNTSDTWLFDSATRRWSFVNASTAPAPRCHMPAAYSPDHDLVLVHGGWRNDYTPGNLFGDTWVFHVGQQRWERVTTTGASPGTTSDHGLVYLPARRQFLLLRGRSGWLFDPATSHWTALGRANVVDELGQPTTYDLGASTACTLDPRTGLVILYGGSYGSPQMTFTDTTVLYDVNTHTFTVLAPPVRPPARVRGGFGFDERLGRVVLFGGVQDQFSTRFDDLWIFDPLTRKWNELLASNAPGRRGGYYGMAWDETRGSFLLACGRQAPEVWLDETLELTLAPARTGTALYTLDLQPAGLQGTWFADVDEPADSRARFFVRRSDNLRTWDGWRPAGGPIGTQRYLQVAIGLKPGSGGEAPAVRAFGFR